MITWRLSSWHKTAQLCSLVVQLRVLSVDRVRILVWDVKEANTEEPSVPNQHLWTKLSDFLENFPHSSHNGTLNNKCFCSFQFRTKTRRRLNNSIELISRLKLLKIRYNWEFYLIRERMKTLWDRFESLGLSTMSTNVNDACARSWKQLRPSQNGKVFMFYLCVHSSRLFEIKCFETSQH